MNKKGFTLIELLATIVILGILGTIGVTSTKKYLIQSRKKSYKIMSQSVYEATMNCIIQGKCDVPTTNNVEISTDYLVANGYIKTLKNPISNNQPCIGTVTVINKNNNNDEYQNYKYSVFLTCDGVANNTLVWPDEKSDQTDLKNITIK